LRSGDSLAPNCHQKLFALCHLLIKIAGEYLKPAKILENRR
jgi:hypothetical protein